jgi:hypothetical protein
MLDNLTSDVNLRIREHPLMSSDIAVSHPRVDEAIRMLRKKCGNSSGGVPLRQQ